MTLIPYHGECYEDEKEIVRGQAHLPWRAVPVLKTLERRKIRFIIPIPVRGKSGGVRKLFEASASRKTTYTFNSPKHGA